MGRVGPSLIKLITLISSLAIEEAMGWNDGNAQNNWNPDSGGPDRWSEQGGQKGPIGGWDDNPGNSFLKGNAHPGNEQPEDGNHGRLEDSIPGTPGQSYPTYGAVPSTSFECQRFSDPGYYGDIETQCQVFHICQADGRQDSFLCPVGTIFNQQTFVCDWWFNVNCQDTPFHYDLNKNLYKESQSSASGQRGNKGSGFSRIWNTMGDGQTSGIGASDWSDSSNQKGSDQMQQQMNQWNRWQENAPDRRNQKGDRFDMEGRNEMGRRSEKGQRMNIRNINDIMRNQGQPNIQKGNTEPRLQPGMRPGSGNQWFRHGNEGRSQVKGTFSRNQRRPDGIRMKKRRKVRKLLKNPESFGKVTSRISQSSWHYERKGNFQSNFDSDRAGNVDGQFHHEPNKHENTHRQNINNFPSDYVGSGPFEEHNNQGKFTENPNQWKNNQERIPKNDGQRNNPERIQENSGQWNNQERIMENQHQWNNQGNVNEWNRHQNGQQNWNENHSVNHQQNSNFHPNEGHQQMDELPPDVNRVHELPNGGHVRNEQDHGDLIWNDNSVNKGENSPNWN